MSLATTGINVVAAVLVAMQKFFMLAEKVRPGDRGACLRQRGSHTNNLVASLTFAATGYVHCDG